MTNNATVVTIRIPGHDALNVWVFDNGQAEVNIRDEARPNLTGGRWVPIDLVHPGAVTVEHQR